MGYGDALVAGPSGPPVRCGRPTVNLSAITENLMQLTTHQQQLVEDRLSNEGRSALIAYVLWFFLGNFGAHRFYLGRIGSGLGMLVLFWFGAFTTAILIGWVFLAFYGIWWIVDVFLISRMIDADRSARRVEIAAEIGSVSRD